LAVEKALAEFAASWAVMSVELMASSAAALVESVLAAEQSRRELVDCAAVLVETTLADERCCQKAVKRSATLGETALAEDRHFPSVLPGLS
jgi:hypothetical protein